MRHNTQLSTAEETLKNFMLEMFDFDGLKKAKIYSKEIKRKDYQAQADRICHYFGYKTVFEYGAEKVNAHITYADGARPKDAPFTETFGGIYE